MSPSRPKIIGTCTLGEPLGQGGMAEVFRAHQEPLNRPVAIKALLPERKDDDEAKARFEREALALAALHHENIVAVHDLVEKYGRLYLIMELVDGVDLAQVLSKGPLPLDVGLLIASELASALEHAHFRKVIHRDIKPSNVMLSRSGQVKLTDFGIAKDQTLDDLTRAGFVVGTLHYLSPEQVGGSKADWRSDIYALGVTMFEALSGQLPFLAEEQSNLLGAVLSGQHKRLRQVAPHLPRSVEKIVERCLAVDPAKRYQRAGDLCRALDRLLAAVLRGTRSARVVAFLRERELVEATDMTLIASDELEAAKPRVRAETVLKARHFERSESQAVRAGVGRGVLIALIVVVFLACGFMASSLVAPEWSLARLAQVSAWIGADSAPVVKAPEQP